MNHRELEETLCRLDSVNAVRVVTEGDRVREVHVLGDPGKPAKQIVRDVQTLAMARFGTNIDRRVISVVQLNADERPADAERPNLIRINESPNGSRTTITVTLGWQGHEHSGDAGGPSTGSARLRIVGEATLAAIEALTDGAAPLALDSIGAAAIGMRQVMVAVVVSAIAGEERVVVGSALSAGDEAEAAVRAVLDALNRRLPQLTG